MSSQPEISCGTPGFAPIARTVVSGSAATAPRFVPGSAWTNVPAGASISSSPRTNVALELALVAELGQTVSKLGRQILVDVEPQATWCLSEDLVVQRVDAAELLDRPLVVLDAELDDDVGHPRIAAVTLDDQERRRLLAA